MNFTTKIEADEVNVYDYSSEAEHDIFGVGEVEWEFYTEIREWGIKDVGVYVVNVRLSIYVKEDDEELLKKIEIDSSIDTEWEIETDTAYIDFSHSVCPQLIDVDMKTKIISINFNEIKMTKKLREQLKLNIVYFVYKKKDGEIRNARGTTNITLLNVFFGQNIMSHKEITRNELITYYDIDKLGWRCLKEDNLIEIINNNLKIN
jgi:hypothetical protein